jgi:hypothetical protein
MNGLSIRGRYEPPAPGAHPTLHHPPNSIRAPPGTLDSSGLGSHPSIGRQFLGGGACHSTHDPYMGIQLVQGGCRRSQIDAYQLAQLSLERRVEIAAVRRLSMRRRATARSWSRPLVRDVHLGPLRAPLPRHRGRHPGAPGCIYCEILRPPSDPQIRRGKVWQVLRIGPDLLRCSLAVGWI